MKLSREAIVGLILRGIAILRNHIINLHPEGQSTAVAKTHRIYNQITKIRDKGDVCEIWVFKWNQYLKELKTQRVRKIGFYPLLEQVILHRLRRFWERESFAERRERVGKLELTGKYRDKMTINWTIETATCSALYLCRFCVSPVLPHTLAALGIAVRIRRPEPPIGGNLSQSPHVALLCSEFNSTSTR